MTTENPAPAKPRLATATRTPAPAAVRTPAWSRKVASLSRWLHIYVSMASFAIVFFFAITGITLNHAEWFAHQQRTTQTRGSLPAAWTAKAEGSKLEIVEKLRTAHGITGRLSDFRIDDAQCSVSFKGPGFSADAFIDRQTGAYDLTVNRMGWVAIINDLHKGRDTGVAWSWVIDMSAGVMCFVSLTGMILIFYLKRKLIPGLLVAAMGAVLSYLVYAYWVL